MYAMYIFYVIVSQDDDVTCIKDIRPASKHHYLILPKKHISNAKAIKSEDSDLCKYSNTGI